MRKKTWIKLAAMALLFDVSAASAAEQKYRKRGQEEICSIARFSRSQSTEEKVFSGRLEQDRMRL